MQLTLQDSKIWFYSIAVDFRKSINGLVYLVQSIFKMDPSEGIFIFHNKSKDKLKILAWHGNGFVLLYKRLESGKFTVISNAAATSVSLDENELSWLLAGLDWQKMRTWNTLSYDTFY